MILIVTCLTAFAASALTFFSGFGLGTLLLPAFALFFPIEVAVASTAVVHLLNGLFKLVLVGRHADYRTVVRFGVPAIAAAFCGAWLLGQLVAIEPITSYSLFGVRAIILPVKLAVGMLLLLVTILEHLPQYETIALPSRLVPLGGILSGFVGGLSGMQGALRSAFLIRLGLSKEAFIGTGVVVATCIDLTRLGVYAKAWTDQGIRLDAVLLTATVLSAFLGASLGSRFFRKLTLRTLHRVVGVMLLIVAVAMITGVL